MISAASGSEEILTIHRSVDPSEFNSKPRRGRLHYFGVFAQTVTLSPLVSSATLAARIAKFTTWVPLKALAYKVSGYHSESSQYLERQYLKTVKSVRDLLFIPSVAARAFRDMSASREIFMDDIRPAAPSDYLNVATEKSSQQYPSYLHGLATFEVSKPVGITEFPATTDSTLKTVMASHIFKPGTLAINFGSPNVCTFVTEQQSDGSIQTTKVDAKSLRREAMHFHPTNGKIQSGVFLVPTNLPPEALERFKAAAIKLEGRKDFTCVNTNCRVLEEAGFSIEGVKMDEIIFPNTLIEHLLFRHVFYTDSTGAKHRVLFNIVNTTDQNLESYFKDVDTAVVGTRLRHSRRKADTEENQRARGAAAKAIVEIEKGRLAAAGKVETSEEDYMGTRRVTISVPSYLGRQIAKIWGRHTLYEVDLSDQREQIHAAFKALSDLKNEPLKLIPFPNKHPSVATRLKRDIFFSGPMIRLIRRHMLGRVDAMDLHAQDIFSHLKSTDKRRLNYALLDDKIVLAKIKPNEKTGKFSKKTADWALSKHAILAGRKEVFCSGEIWYDRDKNCFVLNHESGTYTPSIDRAQLVADMANAVFNTSRSGIPFVVEPPKI